MRFSLLGLVIAALIGCNCDGFTRVECSTPEQCKSPDCINSGCDFTDSGKPLPPKFLGAPEPKDPPLVLERIEPGEEKLFKLQASTESVSKACSHDGQGAGFFTVLNADTQVRARVTRSNQVSLAVFRVELSGKGEPFKCVRSFAPDTGPMKLGAGRWEFVITGQGAGAFSLERETVYPLRLKPGSLSEPTPIEEGNTYALIFKAGARAMSPLVCSRQGASYRVSVQVSAPLRLSLSSNEGGAAVSLGLKMVGGGGDTFCAPPMNQRLVQTLKTGRYELIVESTLPPERLNQMQWEFKLGAL